MDAVDADESGTPIGLRGLPERNGNRSARARAVPHATALAVDEALTQVIEVRDRDSSQTLIAGIAIEQPGTLAQVPSGRPASGPVQAVELREADEALFAVAPIKHQGRPEVRRVGKKGGRRG